MATKIYTVYYLSYQCYGVSGSTQTLLQWSHLLQTLLNLPQWGFLKRVLLVQ